MKYYAVKRGRTTGVLESWEECSKSVHGYPGAEYKSFASYREACEFLKDAGGVDALREDAAAESGKPQQPAQADAHGRRTGSRTKMSESAHRPDDYVFADTARAYVDGSFLAATGEFSYGCVFLIGDTKIRLYDRMKDPELAAMHNVAGEIKGAEAAMRFAVANGITDLTICHDYEGIAKWCTGEWTATKPGTIAYNRFYRSLPEDLRVRFVKVQGHSGDTYNEMADQLARFALGI